MSELCSSAVRLLREKGHRIDGSYVTESGVVKISIDSRDCTPGETIQVARLYPEWPDIERQDFEALRAYQQTLVGRTK